MKRIALIASALCFALGASSSFAEDRMDKMDKMEKMEKPGKTHKKDSMRHSAKTGGMHDGKMDKSERMGHSNSMDRMEK